MAQARLREAECARADGGQERIERLRFAQAGRFLARIGVHGRKLSGGEQHARVTRQPADG